MKILVLSNLYPPDFIGGYELCCAQVVDALLARGHETVVLTACPRTPCPSAPHVWRRMHLKNIYDSYGIQYGSPATRDEWEAEAHFAMAHNVHVMLDALREFAPDVVYVWNVVGMGGLGLIGALMHLRYPWVWYLGDCLPRTLCTRQGKAVPGLVAEFNRHVRGHYMPVSTRVVEEIEACGIRLQGTVESMPNWVCGPRPPDRTSYFRPGECLRIVSAGQIGRHKGIDRIIEAAGMLRAWGCDNFEVDLYGKVTDGDFQPMIERLGLTEQVRLRGQCSQADLVRMYRQHRYDVFAFPTWEREPFGCAPLEAAAHGCVPVMTQSCGVGEWLVDGVHCLKVPRTSGAFAEAFRDILTGHIDLAPIGRRGAAAIWRDFRLERLAPRIEMALTTVAEKRPKNWDESKANEAYRLALLAEKLTFALVQEKALHAA